MCTWFISTVMVDSALDGVDQQLDIPVLCELTMVEYLLRDKQCILGTTFACPLSRRDTSQRYPSLLSTGLASSQDLTCDCSVINDGEGASIKLLLANLNMRHR